jgi:hypothetical protein
MLPPVFSHAQYSTLSLAHHTVRPGFMNSIHPRHAMLGSRSFRRFVLCLGYATSSCEPVHQAKRLA